jgi:hypothetical protein
MQPSRMAEVVPINTTPSKPLDTHLFAVLAARDELTRLRAALAIGSNPEEE